MGIERFMARWATPNSLWSDIETNYVGAEQKLSAFIKN